MSCQPSAVSAALWIAFFSLGSGAVGQTEPASRRVTATGGQVQINQIETSQFPRVVIFATVLKDGVPVAGLTDKDFRVREDEVDQEPLTVVPKLTPLSVVMTLDTSGSMKKRLADAQAAAKSFIQTLDAQDKVGVIRFSRDVKTIHPLGGDRAAAGAAIDATVARGDTALWDALYASLESLATVTGRKAAVLLSDGVDDDGTGRPLSKRTVAEVLALARQVNAPIYAIGIGTELDEVNLRKVATESGALYLNAAEPAELKKLYDGIGKQLAGQYTIFYKSNLPADGAEHRVQLKVGDNTSTKTYLPPASAVVVSAPPPAPPPPPVAPPAKAEPGAGTTISDKTPSADPNAPVALNLGEVVKGRLDNSDRTKKYHYWQVDLPAGDYKFVIDVKRADDRESNVGAELHFMKPDGKLGRQIGKLNAIDMRRRGVFRVPLAEPLRGVVQFANDFTISDYHLAVFRDAEPLRGLFFVQPPPVVPLALGKPITTPVLDGRNPKQSDAYAWIKLAAGDYKLTAEFQRQDQLKSNVGGNVGALGPDGETRVESLLKINKIAPSDKKSAKLSLAEEATITFKLRAEFTPEIATFVVENWTD